MEEGNEGSTKKVAEVEGSMEVLVVQQVKLNDKVTLLEWDFNLNLKYCPQVIDFEAQMLSFSLTESVMDHQEQVQQDWAVQEQFGLHQDQISEMEEMLRALSTKVSSCSTWVDRLTLTESFSRLTFLVLRQGGDIETSFWVSDLTVPGPGDLAGLTLGGPSPIQSGRSSTSELRSR